MAEDEFGNRATATFLVSSPLVAEPAQLAVLASPVETGQPLLYSFAGFQPDAAVRVFVEGGGGMINIADSSGSGEFGFTNNAPAGSYTLVAEDDFGHRATATFDVIP